MANLSFQAGVGRVNITPPLSLPHAGWGAQAHINPDGVEADLWATVLVVTDGTEMAAVVDLDLVMLTREENEAIQAEVSSVLGIQPKQVRVSVTHAHSGPPPSTWDWLGGGSVLQGYYELLPFYASGAARLALRNLRPAYVGVGRGQSFVAVNRRETAPSGKVVVGVNPDGVIDPEVLVIRIDGQDATPLAAIIGYTMHPTTLGPTNRLLSPDWPGHLKRTVEALTGATCLFAQGASGDIGPGPEGFTDRVEVARKLGAMVGCEAARVYLGLRLPPVRYRHERVWESGAPLARWTAVPIGENKPRVRVMTRDIPLPLRPQQTVAEAERSMADAHARLRDLRARGAQADEIEAATFMVKRASMALTRAQTFGGRGEFPVTLHLLQIGPAVLASIPCEPFAEIGLAVKRASPCTYTWFGGYVGGWFGYLPTEAEYARGGYEVDTSPFTPKAAQRVIDETAAALKELTSDNDPHP